MVFMKKIIGSLFWKMMLLLNAFVIIPAIVIFIFVDGMITRSIRDEIFNNLTMVTAEKQDKFSRQLDHMERVAQTLANDNYVKDYFTELKHGQKSDPQKLTRIRTMLENEVAKSNGIYENLLFYYNKIAYVDGIGGKSVGKETQQNATKYGVIRISPSTGRPVMVNYVAIPEAGSEETLYILTMGIELNNVTAKLIDNGQNSQLRTLVVDSAGLVIASEQQNQIMKFDLLKAGVATADFFKEVLAKGKGSGILTLNGQQYLAAYVKDPNRDLYTISYTPLSKVTEKSVNLALGILLVLVICIGGGAGVSYIASKRMIIEPIKNLTDATEKMVMGDCNVQIAVKSRDELGALGRAFNSLIDNVREGAAAAQRIANGDLNVQLTVRSENDLLNQNLNEMIKNIRALIDDINSLVTAAINGQLGVRADEARHSGEFQNIVSGVNTTLEALTQPIRVAADYIEKIGQGEIPKPIDDEYQGDFNELKNSINACIEGLGALVESKKILANLALNDYTEQVEGDYQGVYGEIATSINEVRERMSDILRVTLRIADGDFSDLPVLKQIGRRCENDYLMPAYIKLMENVQALVRESLRLSDAAVAGQLDARGDVERFTGEYRQVVEGLNQTLNAIAVPLAEAGQILRQMAVNDFTVLMEAEKYQGMFRDLAENLNAVEDRFKNIQRIALKVADGDTGELEKFKQIGKISENDQLIPAFTAMMQSIQDLIDEVTRLSAAAVAGDLQARGNTKQFAGGYQQVLAGFNQTLDAIVKPVSEASGLLQEMAAGNLALEVRDDYQGDHALLAEALGQTLNSFNQVLSEFLKASDQVASGAKHVAASSQVLSQSATEQAATVQEITSSMAEIAARTKQNAVNATQANQLAIHVQANASDGNAQMQKMLEAMAEINRASESISKIIKVIDEIAFQTNILALNAAVEAARAGQHGKGFAVVAEEVRNLAGRSARAAKETTDLIEGSLQKVEAGTAIANQTAAALQQIVTGVADAANLIGEIAVASNEQASGITQVNLGINQVAQVTQTNTATSEESASASEELAGQAEMLRGMVQRFKLKGPALLGDSQPLVASNERDSVRREISRGRGQAAAAAGQRFENDFGKY